MNKLRITPPVAEDLTDISAYVTAHGSREAAATLLREINSNCQLLRRFPYSGRIRDDLEPGLRSFAVGNYVILYQVAYGVTEIKRVVHGMRDLPKLFENPPQED